MARKKQEAPSGGNAPWMNTFADLMNLLLCFFVLLFALSDVNGQKFEQVAVSMANSFGVFDAGGSAIGEGQLVSSGMTQLNNLGEYFTNMGVNSSDSNKNNNSNNNSGVNSSSNKASGGSDTSSDGSSDNGKSENVNSGASDSGNSKTDTNTSEDLNAAKEKLLKEMSNQSEAMYDQVSDLTGQYNLGDYVQLSIDPEYQYVQLTLKGSILFDSGRAEIIEQAKPVLSKIGDVLSKFNGYTVEIIGHTDNVPMHSDTFKDNNWLSSARALNAAEFLIDNNKLDPSKIKYSGRGEYEPIASNDTEAGRAKNRRIEIRIYNELSGR